MKGLGLLPLLGNVKLSVQVDLELSISVSTDALLDDWGCLFDGL